MTDLPRPELARKGLHVAGLVIPLCYWRFAELFVFVFFPLAAIVLALELSRLKITAVAKWYIRVFGPFLRPSEYNRPSGGFYFVLGAAITILIFPRDMAISALLVLAVSDPAAAFFGRRYGRRKIFGKTIFGSLAFFVSAWLVLMLYFGGNPFWQLPAAFLGALVESLPGPQNDNLTIPPAVALTTWLLVFR